MPASSSMRPGQRNAIKAALIVMVMTMWCIVLLLPLAFDGGKSIEPRVKHVLITPPILLFLLSLALVDAISADATCRLSITTWLGMLLWPVAALPMCGLSCGLFWVLACRYPDTASNFAGNYGRMLNTRSCPEDGSIGDDWKIISAWLASVAIFSLTTALLVVAVPAKKDIIAHYRAKKFKKTQHLRRPAPTGGDLEMSPSALSRAEQLALQRRQQAQLDEDATEDEDKDEDLD